jgi:hypothetical protein
MELIENGYFETGGLGPWSSCDGGALEGEVTNMPENPVFCSSHNLKLLGNDCVRQQLARVAIASEGNLSLWVRWYPTTAFEHISVAEAGRLEAAVEYSSGGESDVAILDLDALRARGVAMFDPVRVSIAVDVLRYVTAVRLRCHRSAHPWYVSGVSMEGYFVGGGDERKARARMDERLQRIERRLGKLERFVTTALSAELRPSRSRPAPQVKLKTGKQ